MGIFTKRTEQEAQQAAMVEKSGADVPMQQTPIVATKAPFVAWFLGLVASIGGFMFGYVSAQISGFFMMHDFARRFGQSHPDGSLYFSPVRQGTITSMVPAGALIGSLIVGKLADVIGRRRSISAAAFFSCIGIVIEISSSNHWAQFAVGRFVNGLGLGALSVVVPMYQSESAPKSIRAILVASYQLFITLGIWLANMVSRSSSLVRVY
jgi:SP family sugar:H+ symporter-like MFS transporter